MCLIFDNFMYCRIRSHYLLLALTGRYHQTILFACVVFINVVTVKRFISSPFDRSRDHNVMKMSFITCCKCAALTLRRTILSNLDTFRHVTVTENFLQPQFSKSFPRLYKFPRIVD